MAGTIKGITIEFRGDTTSVDKAMRQISSETRSLNKELSSIDKALKFNPKNVDLWRQKQQVLSEKIAQTNDKLDVLRQTQAQMDANGVDKTSADYRNLQRQIIETESQLKTFKSELKQVGNVNLRAASESVKELGNNLASAGQAMKGLSMAGAAVVASLGALAYKSGAWADDLNTMSKVYGIGTQELQKYAASAALVDVEVETIAGAHRKLTKAMSGAEDETGATAEAFATLGVNITDANGELRSSDDVFNDVIVALGKVENETQRDALAMQIMGKSAADLNPLIKDGGETYKRTAEIFSRYGLDYIDQETLDNANAFNDSLDTMKALGGVALQQIGTQLAGVLAPALEKVVDFVGRIAGWLANLNPKVLVIIGAIAGVIAVISPLLIGVGKVALAISSVMGLMATLNVSLASVAATMLPIVAAIAAVIAIGVLLYKHWDQIKAWAVKLWTSIKQTFTNMKNGIVQIWTSIKTFVTNLINNLKNAVINAIRLMVSTVVGRFYALKTSANTIFTGLRDRIAAIFGWIRDKITTIVTSMRDRVTSYFTSMRDRVSNLVTSVRDRIAYYFGSARDTVSNVVGSIRDKVSSVFSSVYGTVSGIWNNIKNAIVNPIQSAINFVSSAIQKIKSILSGTISLPRIKLPHFRISGKFSLAPPSVPKVSIDWYKTGGIFSGPSIIGVGEAGPEAVVPLDTLWNKMDAIASAAGSGSGITINVYGGTSDAQTIAQEVRRVLINEEKRRRLAWQ